MQRLMTKINQKEYPGVTSLLFVIAIGLVLVVMVGGISALTIREIQQASNTDLSNRALQTAEAGVKFAVQELSTNPAFQLNECPKGTKLNSFNATLGNNQEVTCLTIDSLVDGGSYETFVRADDSTELIAGDERIYTGLTDTPEYLRVRWNNPQLGDSLFPWSYGGGLYPASVDYTGQGAAFIELSILYWPKSSFMSKDVKIATFLLAPVSTAGSSNGRSGVSSNCIDQNSTAYNYKCGTVDFSDASGTRRGFSLASALGITSGELATKALAIRIQPRYKSTHIRIEAVKNDNTAVKLISNKASIDSTAKVGNLYRRIKATRVVRDSVFSNLFTSALYSAKNASDTTTPKSERDICKDFTVKEIIPSSADFYKVHNGTPNCNNIAL